MTAIEAAAGNPVPDARVVSPDGYEYPRVSSLPPIDHFTATRSARPRAACVRSTRRSAPGREPGGGGLRRDDRRHNPLRVLQVPQGPAGLAQGRAGERARSFDVRKPVDLCAPADKNGEGDQDVVTHLEGYQIAPIKRQARLPPTLGLGGTNQFHVTASPLAVDTIKPDRPPVPTAKNLTAVPDLPRPSRA